MLHAHSFDAGYRYEDYTTGEKVASYGIAALVAASVGGKIAKATGLTLILKKFGAIIFACIVGIFYKMKNFFKRNSD